MPKEHVAIFALLCIIAFGAGYWHSSPKGDSDERAEGVAPPAPTVVTNTLKEVVTNIVPVPQPTPPSSLTPTPAPVKPRPQPTPTNIVPAGLQNAIIEKAIRKELKKSEGELTKADFEKVTRLYLQSTKITNVGLKEVAKLQKLKKLYLHDTQITKAGVAELKKALPKCSILSP